MIIIPAIDLKDGMCVQLVQGRMEDATVFGTDPAEMARRWMDEGARWLHVVDLDGAFAGATRNLDAIRDAVARIRAGEIEDISQLNYSELVKIEELRADETEPLRAQLDAFIHSVRTGERPVVSAEDGLAAVSLAQRIVNAISPEMVL